MEWLGNGASLHLDEETDPSSTDTDFTSVRSHQKLPSSNLCDCAVASLCQSQKHCVKASIVSSWRLAEAQDQLCSLGVHSSESLEQERARTRAGPTELVSTVEEWRRKESMLGGSAGSWDVFDKSIINVQNQSVEMEQDNCKTFLQKYEQDVRHFGMLRRWDDSQRFLSDMPHLICEETANFLILWSFRLQQEGKEALMEQVAHQAVVMQFILEMASNSQQDPRGCFRQFFHKAKEGQNVYLEVFHKELEAFKQRVKEYIDKCRNDISNTEQQNSGTNYKLDSKETTDLFPQQVAEYNSKHCLNTGLWTSTGTWTKDDSTETEDIRMMETS